jgi:hypothetical protein
VSFPKLDPARIGAVRQNHRIIRIDVCDPGVSQILVSVPTLALPLFGGECWQLIVLPLRLASID